MKQSERATADGRASIAAEPRRCQDGVFFFLLVSSCKGSHQIAKPHEQRSKQQQLWTDSCGQAGEKNRLRCRWNGHAAGVLVLQTSRDAMVAAGRPLRCMVGQVPDGLNRDTCSRYRCGRSVVFVDGLREVDVQLTVFLETIRQRLIVPASAWRYFSLENAEPVAVLGRAKPRKALIVARASSGRIDDRGSPVEHGSRRFDV